MTKLWQYTKQTYGDFGPENRLYTIFHQGKYSGGHPSTYLDGSHDFRNVTDCGPGPWKSGPDIPSHEAGHVVEGANNGIHGSPAFPLWQDSKWMEFYQYDAYVALGMDADAKRVFDRFTATTDGFPRAGTHWFRDWFYPLWKDHGHAQVMVKFFKLLSMYFPKGNGKNPSYTRDLNWGEFVHFMSGAAGTGPQSPGHHRLRLARPVGDPVPEGQDRLRDDHLLRRVPAPGSTHRTSPASPGQRGRGTRSQVPSPRKRRGTG
jgi:hypothetical protein